MIFEFDPKKNAINKIKHGIDFIEAQALWEGKRIEIQAKIAGKEKRYAILGKIKGTPYTIIVTYRGTHIRIISARRSSENETEIYEQNIKDT